MTEIAVIGGDGVGPEVVGEACKVLEATGLPLRLNELPWGSAYFADHGTMMPADALDELRRYDAILLGAVGSPDVADDVTLWGLLLAIRQGLDLWANIRPARLLDGIPCPLAGRGPNDVDILFVRENTEGEYAGVGGRAHRGYEHEVAIETAVFTRHAVERVVRYAFGQAATRRGRLTSATKSNASRFGYVLWDEVVESVATEYPMVESERVLVDALALRLVRDPASFDVVVASNLFADILTDLAGALQGGLGMCASANLAPGSSMPPMFEPVHGSAPDIAGRKLANPCGAIWSAALMLDHLGQPAAASNVMAALEQTCLNGPRTPDVGGAATTSDVGDAIAERVADLSGGRE